MTKEDFIAGYLARSFVTKSARDAFMEEYVALPCSCGQIGCKGWAMVANNPHALKAHADLYAPAVTPLRRPGADPEAE